MAGRHYREPDGAAAGHQDRLSGNLCLLHTVDTRAHRFKDAALFIRERVVQHIGGVGTYLGIFRKRSVCLDTIERHVLADMAVARSAVRTGSVPDVRLYRYTLSDKTVFYILPELNDLARRLMPDGTREHLYPFLCPGTPVVDAEIGSADGCAVNLHQHFIVARYRNRQVRTKLQALPCPCLYNSSHVFPFPLNHILSKIPRKELAFRGIPSL